METFGLITFRDNAGMEKDVHYHDVIDLSNLLTFTTQVSEITESGIAYYSFSQGITQPATPSTGEFDSVTQYLKIFMLNTDTGKTFYDILPAPKASIMETQRGGKRMIKAFGDQYAEYMSALKDQTITFKEAYLVGYKY